jgi:non-heme chloroperoxidase
LNVAWVDVDGLRIHVQDLGTGPALVLISGFGLDHELWNRQVKVLTDHGYRVLCVSQRGHGYSDKPLHGYDIDRLAADLAGVLTVLGITNSTVVGHSFAGQVAFRAAATAPELVASLVLVGSNAVRASRGPGFPFGAQPEPAREALLADEHANRLAARYRTIASAFGTQPDPATVDWLVRCSLRMPTWAAAACYRTLLTSDLIADIPHVTQQVLQVIGSADPAHSAEGARWLQQRLSCATLVEIPDCGHYPMLEAPDAFEAALLKFLNAA